MICGVADGTAAARLPASAWGLTPDDGARQDDHGHQGGSGIPDLQHCNLPKSLESNILAD